MPVRLHGITPCSLSSSWCRLLRFLYQIRKTCRYQLVAASEPDRRGNSFFLVTTRLSALAMGLTVDCTQSMDGNSSQSLFDISFVTPIWVRSSISPDAVRDRLFPLVSKPDLVDLPRFSTISWELYFAFSETSWFPLFQNSFENFHTFRRIIKKDHFLNYKNFYSCPFRIVIQLFPKLIHNFL